MKRKKGSFIVIDGNDGSGKATQVRLLERRLKKEWCKVSCVTYPDYKNNFFGGLISNYLHDSKYNWKNIHPEIASIVYACDRWEGSSSIRRLLNDGYIILSDRYASSNQIHQGGRISDNHERDNFISWLNTLEYEVFKIPKPDKIIYLDVPLSISQELLRKRYSSGGKPDEYEKDPDFLRNSKITGDWLSETQENWERIDCAPNGALLSERKINDEIYNKIINFI